jgi:GDPmannose 4,6-dehydratase
MSVGDGSEIAERSKSALVTGITGQDGSYLAEFLLGKGYVVHGITRAPGPELGCSSHLLDRVTVHRVANQEAAWMEVVAEVRPDELYHFAADSFVPNGWENPLQNVHSNLGLPVCLLEAIRRLSPHTRMLNACSREIFGNCRAAYADETMPMQPVTPYGINKAASRWTVESYRQHYGIFAASAILFNHESPRRGVHFVTRKISKRVAEIRLGLADGLELGTLSVRRDWGFAGDFVDAMWRMLQLPAGEDFVIGTGTTHSIQDFVSQAFDCVGLRWQDHVQSVDYLSRPSDTVGFAADISKANSLLDWSPRVSFERLVRMMVEADLKGIQGQRADSSKAA